MTDHHCPCGGALAPHAWADYLECIVCRTKVSYARLLERSVFPRTAVGLEREGWDIPPEAA
jgi:hypothetical protein